MESCSDDRVRPRPAHRALQARDGGQARQRLDRRPGPVSTCGKQTRAQNQPVFWRDFSGNRLGADAVPGGAEARDARGVDGQSWLHPPRQVTHIAGFDIVTARQDHQMRLSRNGEIDDAIGQGAARMTRHDNVARTGDDVCRHRKRARRRLPPFSPLPIRARSLRASRVRHHYAGPPHASPPAAARRARARRARAPPTRAPPRPPPRRPLTSRRAAA